MRRIVRRVLPAVQPALRVALGCAVLVALPACDSGEPSARARLGRFEAEVTGEQAFSMEGDAGFFAASPPSASAFSLFLADRTRGFPRAVSISFFRPDGSQPPVGTYPLGFESDTSVVMPATSLVLLSGGELLFASGGEVRITRSDAERVEGSFEASLQALPSDPDEEPADVDIAAVTGTFEAVRMAYPAD